MVPRPAASDLLSATISGYGRDPMVSVCFDGGLLFPREELSPRLHIGSLSLSPVCLLSVVVFL